MSGHHEKCCLKLMSDMSDSQFLHMLGELKVELERRFPDLQEHIDRLGVTTENTGIFGRAVIDTVMTQCKVSTK
jgi:hypothetical protein